MRVLMAVAVMLLATSAAEAQYSFEYDGRIIRIDPDRGTVSIPGVFDNTPKDTLKKAKRARTDLGSHARQQSKTEPLTPEQTAPAPSQQATVPAAAPVNPAPATSAAPTNNAPAETAAIPPAPTAAPEKPAPAQQEQVGATPTPAAAAPITAAAPPSAAPAAPQPADNVATAAPPPTAAPVQHTEPPAPPPATARDQNSPVGVWLTEEKEGKVRIEPCGANLCGYSVDAKSNGNAEQVLINMKPGKDQKWSGRILDPSTGSSYDSTIALIGANALRVQGCAFGGMFCGGQTWTRVN